jgi:hypothetical protein
MKQLHIFRAGIHQPMQGGAIEFREADLAATAAAYDPAFGEAPIVVGHPKLDAPAYGWVRALRAEGGDLVAEPHQVEPAFAEMVQAGYINDQRFALRAAERALNAGKSRQQANAWLLQRQLAAPQVQEALTQLYDTPQRVAGEDATDAGGEGEWVEPELLAARRFAAKRRLGNYGDAQDRAQRFSKDLAKMARAGFGYDLCRQVLG